MIKRLNDVGEVKFLLEHLPWEHIINLFWNKCACQTVQGDDDDVDDNLHGFMDCLQALYQLVMPECYDTHTWSLYTTIKRLNDVGEVKFLLENLPWEHIINLFRNKCACQTIREMMMILMIIIMGWYLIF